MFQPKLISSLKGYTFDTFIKDLLAGIIVGIVALPLAIAFGIASGVSPERGIITAIIAGFIISALGGSRVQIGGPTGAFIVIVYGIVQEYGLSGLAMATMMAGVLMILMGALKLGIVIKFIPYPVVVGFTSGIAVVIFFSQINDAMGMQIASLPADFIEKLIAYVRNIGNINWYAAGISIATVFIVFFTPRIIRKIPGTLIAIIVITAVAQLTGAPVETIGSRFGEIKAAFPVMDFQIPGYDAIRDLMQPAFVIAILGAIESLLSATVADGMIGGNHRSNMELIAQGAANIVSPLVGGIPATGAIARTVTNIKNGGKTPVAGIIHAFVLALIFFFFIPYASLIPMSCLAGILIVVAYNMSEWRTFVAFKHGSKSEMLALLVTFSFTVIFDLSLAIGIGLVLALLLLLRRLSMVSDVKKHIDIYEHDDEFANQPPLEIPKDVEVYEINGPFFFGVAHKFEEATKALHDKRPKVRIVRMRRASFIDSTGLHHLEELFKKSKANHIELVLSGLNPQPLNILKRSGLYGRIGAKNVCTNIDQALLRSREILIERESLKQRA